MQPNLASSPAHIKSTGLYSKAGNMERAEALVTAMEEEGLEGTLGLYNTMMDGYAHKRAEAECLNAFRRLQASTTSIFLFSETGSCENCCLNWTFQFFVKMLLIGWFL